MCDQVKYLAGQLKDICDLPDLSEKNNIETEECLASYFLVNSSALKKVFWATDIKKVFSICAKNPE